MNSVLAFVGTFSGDWYGLWHTSFVPHRGGDHSAQRQIADSQPFRNRDPAAPIAQRKPLWLASEHRQKKAVLLMSSTTNKSVLIIEDDPDIRHLLGIRLKHAGYETIEAGNGTDGLRLVHERRPALVILDIGLPGMDGWQVLQRIRDVTTTPVMILSARGLEAEKVRGLQSGADDYVTKPFGHQELVARIGVLLRRATDDNEPETEYADPRLQIDIRSRSVQADGVDVQLTPGEFRLLLALIQHVGQILSPEQLLELAWDDPTTTNTSRVKFTVLRLRRKLGWDDPATSPIESVRGFGYRYRIVDIEAATVVNA